jgi:hypothetical protein
MTDIPAPKAVLDNYRASAPENVADQVKLFNGMKPADKLELLFHMCMVHGQMLQNINDAIAAAGEDLPRGSKLILPGRIQ